VFGPHLIIDGSRCDTRKLADRVLVEQVMNDYPAAIGMTKIGGPYMFEYQAPDPAYSGVSGIVVIAESHIAIHTFPELDYFTMDIFSCKNFDHELAIEYIKKAFDVKEMDRMLVQRGLSFRGPHHGSLGATDELIAAANARLEAGIISKETAIPGEVYGAGKDIADERDAAIARIEQRTQTGETTGASANGANGGKMLWPQYGVTPDYGTYGAAAGETADCEPCARGGATVMPLTHTGAAPLAADGRALPASEPAQVNPTASISGLLDKLGYAGGHARSLGRGVAIWERLARDSQTTIALALSTPVIADGLREMLVYAAEHRYVDTVVASADDLFADLYESLGYAHFAGSQDEMIATEEGHQAALAFFMEFLNTVEPGTCTSSNDLWRLLGAYLPAHAPRKGLLQAAATADVALFTPDLNTSVFGGALLTARSRGLALDSANDVIALARLLGRAPRLGIIRAGAGLADALVGQARDVAAALGIVAPTLSGSVSLNSARALAQDDRGEHHVAIAAGADLVLPLALTALAQRLPGGRRRTAGETRSREATPALV
jgi:S-adenosylmethionine decarboxylase